MKIATIGTSKIAHQLAEAFLACGAELEAVYSRNQETAAAFAAQFQGKKTYTNFEELLQDPDVEIVYVASPNSIHAQQVTQILQAKKHVICEKPITLHTKEFQELCKLAEAKNRFLFEAITTLHMPNYRVIKEKLKELRDIRLVTCDLSQYSARYENLLVGVHQNVFDPQMGGGALYDLGVYCLHFVLGLFGKPDEIQAQRIWHKDVDTSGTIMLKYPDMTAILTYGKDSHGEPGFCIQARNGYLRGTGPCSRLQEVEWISTQGKERLSLASEQRHHIHEIRDFLDIIRNKDVEEQKRLWKQSELVLQVIDAIQKEGDII